MEVGPVWRRWRQRVARKWAQVRTAARNAWPGFVRDLHVYGGLGLAAWGLWMWWDPAGYIAGGAVLLAIGLFGLPSWRREER